MCSIGEDDFGDEGGMHAMIPDVKADKDLMEDSLLQVCNKCKKPEAIYKLPFRQAECQECFLIYARHKFRAALGSSKVLPKDAKVILIFDGSGESEVLLDMLHHAQTQNTFKRLHCTATVIYIDDFQLLENDSASDDYKRFLEKIEIFLQKFTYFDCFFVPLVHVRESLKCITNIKNIREQQYHLQYIEEKQSFLKYIDSIKSLTSRQDFLKHHRSKLTATIAKHLDSKFTFTAEISLNLANDLLAAVALGRGGSAALDVALVDDRLGDDIKLIRPLKDLTTAEIDLYLKARNLQPLKSKRNGLEAGSTLSLQNLTKAFMENLQQNFSATVSTVFRLGDKIAVNQDAIRNFRSIGSKAEESRKIDCCLFCNSFLDYQDSTTLLAIEFSRLASESSCTLKKLPIINAKAKENVDGSGETKNLKTLCHACRNLCKDCPNSDLML